MAEIEIHDYARQLLEAHGEMAVVEAAQKARSFEEKGQTEEAETWRGIEAALKLMRGPNVSSGGGEQDSRDISVCRHSIPQPPAIPHKCAILHSFPRS
jgi:hypothetical protein